MWLEPFAFDQPVICFDPISAGCAPAAAFQTMLWSLLPESLGSSVNGLSMR